MARLETIEADLRLAQTDMQAARTELESAQEQIDALQSALDTLGLEGAEDIQAIAGLVGRLEETLVPFISSVADRVESFRQAILSLKETVERLNELPLVNLEIPGIEQLDQASESLQNLYNQIVEGRQKVTDVAELTTETVTSLTTGFADLEASAQALNATLEAYDAKFNAYLAEIYYWQANLPRWINIAAVVSTILLVWLVVSQLAVFIIGWSFYRRQDLLETWRERPLLPAPRALRETKPKT
jgi:chromosome segregation ATPase